MQVQLWNSCTTTRFDTKILGFFWHCFFFQKHFLSHFSFHCPLFAMFPACLKLVMQRKRIQQGKFVMRIISVTDRKKICLDSTNFKKFFNTPNLTTFSQLLYKIGNHLIVILIWIQQTVWKQQTAHQLLWDCANF